jgi:uncharacterized glyoxalase superfamily protein PhnB
MCKHVPEVIAFLEGAFGAREEERILDEDGHVAHAVMAVGDSKVMLGEPTPAMKRLKARPAHHYVFVSDVHAAYERALTVGGTPFSKPIGPRLGAVTDPGGNFWWIARKAMVSTTRLRRRNAAYRKKQAGK